eukprot:scaffold75962_cov69-Phaeocystis_antarctica.AAC.1
MGGVAWHGMGWAGVGWAGVGWSGRASAWRYKGAARPHPNPDPNPHPNPNPNQIALKELRARKIPITIRRFLPDGSYEDWDVDELIIPDEHNLMPRDLEIDNTARSTTPPGTKPAPAPEPEPDPDPDPNPNPNPNQVRAHLQNRLRPWRQNGAPQRPTARPDWWWVWVQVGRWQVGWVAPQPLRGGRVAHSTPSHWVSRYAYGFPFSWHIVNLYLSCPFKKCASTARSAVSRLRLSDAPSGLDARCCSASLAVKVRLVRCAARCRCCSRPTHVLGQPRCDSTCESIPQARAIPRAGAWHVYGMCMACVWRLHGVCMACARHVHVRACACACVCMACACAIPRAKPKPTPKPQPQPQPKHCRTDGLRVGRSAEAREAPAGADAGRRLCAGGLVRKPARGLGAAP